MGPTRKRKWIMALQPSKWFSVKNVINQINRENWVTKWQWKIIAKWSRKSGAQCSGVSRITVYDWTQHECNPVKLPFCGCILFETGSETSNTEGLRGALARLRNKTGIPLPSNSADSSPSHHNHHVSTRTRQEFLIHRATQCSNTKLSLFVVVNSNWMTAHFRGWWEWKGCLRRRFHTLLGLGLKGTGSCNAIPHYWIDSGMLID